MTRNPSSKLTVVWEKPEPDEEALQRAFRIIFRKKLADPEKSTEPGVDKPGGSAMVPRPDH